MYKSKLQELCQRRSWNLPEYTTVKDGPDHIPRFTALVVVNGQNFETPALCKSAKDAHNTAARIAFDHFNVPPPPRVHHLPSSSLATAASAVFQPPVCAVSLPTAHVPEMQSVGSVSPVPAIPVPVAPLPSALPLPPPRLLAANNNSNIKHASREIMQPNREDTVQTSMVYRTQIGSHEAQTNAKRAKSSPENDTANLVASPDNNSSSGDSSSPPSQVEQSILADPLTEQSVEAFHSKTMVFPRKLSLPIPEGTSVMPYSDDHWIAYKVEFNKEPTA